MRNALRAGLVVLALPCSVVVQAAEEDAQLWLQSGATVNLGKGFKLSEEFVARFSDNRKGLYELENNLLLGYALDKTVTVWAGYTHDPNYNAGKFTAMERRAREQITFDNVARVGAFAVSLRVRAEQRWRDAATGTGWRLRPYVRVQATLDEKRKIALALSHESFLNLNATSFQRSSGYDRMRNQVSLRLPVIDKLSTEIGYLNQYGVVRRGTDRMDHSATLSLSLSL